VGVPAGQRQASAHTPPFTIRRGSQGLHSALEINRIAELSAWLTRHKRPKSGDDINRGVAQTDADNLKRRSSKKVTQNDPKNHILLFLAFSRNHATNDGAVWLKQSVRVPARRPPGD
jgi:hypothetical protein